MPARIAISRDTGYADRLRKYRVVCDGAEIGWIADGTSVEFTVSPGAHRLILKVDWCSSNEVQFTIVPGQTLRFACGSNLRGSGILLAVYYALFARNQYLWLKQNGI